MTVSRIMRTQKLDDLIDFLRLEELKMDVTLRGAVAIEYCLDMGKVIEILGGVKDFAEKFAPAVSLRNILVHMYARVDLEAL